MRQSLRLLLALCLMVPLAAICDEGEAQASVRGTAFYHETIDLPPGAVFEATLADVARADAPAMPLGRAILDGRSGPRFAFTSPYAPARIDPRGRYAVRATITLDGQLLFTSDTVHPVISGGHPDTVEIPLRQVGPPHGLRLPATFRGVLPCADCPGIRHHLDLWADNDFHLRREWLERGLVRDDLGRWHFEPGPRALILTGDAEMPLQFQVIGPNELRALDLQGNPIESALDYALRSAGTLTPDIGTGSGVLAIAAAKCGAKVCATDTDPRAVAAAERNTALNGVKIEVRGGDLFGAYAGPFDVILANLPNEIVAPSYRRHLRPEDIRTFAGGEAGNEHLIALLDSASALTSPRSRLFLGVHSLTDYHATLRSAIRRYTTRLLDLEELPAKAFVTDNLTFYQALNEAGIIRIFRNATGQWCTYGYVYELALA